MRTLPPPARPANPQAGDSGRILKVRPSADVQSLAPPVMGQEGIGEVRGPRSATSAAGVPVNSTCPRRTTTRSARSARRPDARPTARRRRARVSSASTSSSSCRREAGSRPTVASSISSTSGQNAHQRAPVPPLRRLPPDSARAGSRALGQAEAGQLGVDALARPCAAEAVQPRGSAGWRAPTDRDRASAAGTPTPMRASAGAGAAGEGLWPQTAMRPPSATNSPDSSWNSVDLPAPFGPSSATNSPRPTSEADAVERLARPVGLDDARPTASSGVPPASGGREDAGLMGAGLRIGYDATGQQLRVRRKYCHGAAATSGRPRSRLGQDEFQHDAAWPAAEEDDAVAKRQRLVEVVGHEQHGRALAHPVFEQQLAQGARDRRIERHEGLIEQQQARAHGEGARERHAPLLTAGKLARVAIQQPAEFHRIERLGAGEQRPSASTSARLSRTVSHGISRGVWNSMPRSGGASMRGRGSRHRVRRSPRAACLCRSRLGPTRHRNSPAATSSWRPASTGTSLPGQYLACSSTDSPPPLTRAT